MIEALPTPRACSKESRLNIQRSLHRLAGFYPKLPVESNQTQLSAHPLSLGVKTLYRTLAIQSFDVLSRKDLGLKLSEQAINDPQDIYGDLLAALYANEAKQDGDKAEEMKSVLSLKVQTQDLTLKLDKGRLTWDWDYKNDQNLTADPKPKDPLTKSKAQKIQGDTDVLWFKIYDQDQNVSKILMMSFPSQFNPKLHKELTRRKSLGSFKKASSFKLIRHERNSSRYTSLNGERVRAYTWEVPPLIKAWAQTQFKETVIESNKSNQ